MFNLDRHEALTQDPYDPGLIRKTIHDIVAQALLASKDQFFWVSPEDMGAPLSVNKNIYLGSTGIVVGLNRLSKTYSIDLPWTMEEAIESIWEKYKKEPDIVVEGPLLEGDNDPKAGQHTPSFFMGSVGILLIRHEYSPTTREESKKILIKEIRENLKHQALEPLWGASGTIIAACHLWDKANDPIWQELIQEYFDYYWSQFKEYKSTKIRIWNQKLYGESLFLTGAGHGFIGNLFPLLKSMDALNRESRTLLLNEGLQTVLDTATIEGNEANWQSNLDGLDRDRDPFLVQWCHGAPGFIMSLDPLAPNQRPDIDELLIKGGNLIWKAGPLKKKVALCHGTDGNAFAFLKLFQRTKDELWLDRAKKFAMHAINQRSARHTVWNGDMGLALFLDSCLRQDSEFPFLDWIT